MKIGILTFHTPLNYGAVLQVFALQTFLKTSFPSASVKVIDFKTEEHINKYKIFPKFRKNIFKFLIEFVSVLFKYKELSLRRIKFLDFVSEELTLTRRYSSVIDFLNNYPKMDFYIVGSDQVFHPLSKYKNVYYLDFPKNDAIKVAYAPSFGMSNFNPKLAEELHRYLIDFDFLSCREKDGAAFISSVINKETIHVLDPVFLLQPQKWQQMMVKPTYNFKYIFIYDLNGGDILIQIAKKIQKITGFKIVCQTQNAKSNYKIDIVLFDNGPRDFVGLVANAEFVITDSFHGVAFSVLFQKKFYTYIAKPLASTRVMSLLNSLNLSFAIIEKNKFNEFEFSVYNHIEYNELLNYNRDLSINYLLNSLSNKKA